MKAEIELRAIVERGGGNFRSLFVGHTQQGVGALVIFTSNGEEFQLPLSDVSEESVRRLVRMTSGWRRYLYMLYKHLTEGAQ